MWFAGGPTRKPYWSPNPGPSVPGDWQYAWGYLRGTYGSLQGTVPSGPSTKVVVDDGKPCSCYNNSFANTINRIDASNIPYSPVFQNSNSLVETMFNNAGLNVPTLSQLFWTPAYSNDLNSQLH